MTMDYSREPHGLYFMIDNKSFYASVESIERGLNPLKSCLIVMSEADNTGTGLVLAASPTAKRLFGISNVSRQYEVPRDPRILVVPPRMNLYIQKNLAINKIFRQYVADSDLFPYSIDESILDMTKSWRLFGKTPEEVARRIQLRVRRELGLYTTVGIGENPVQAKLALDLQAKHDHDLIGRLTYEDFGEHIWPMTNLEKVWSIGHRTAAHLQRLGIHSMGDLAHVNPYELRHEMGLIGTQLFALSWGIDRTELGNVRPPKEKSWSNSQVLPRDYKRQSEIELVLREIGQQVTSRMRHHHQQAGCVSLFVGFAWDGEADDGRGGLHHTHRIDPTDNAHDIIAELIRLFRQYWEGQPVRNIGVGLSRLSASQNLQLDLFQNPERQIKNNQFDRVIDELRDRFGKTAVIPASSLLRGGTMLRRSALVGGHNGGNSFD
ncbi:Y-family DNA polymerase [Levilactobacillus senmaizukei]|uniref:Y-family DNA polymerase n=1 Tax=Levilactobacillus senmaizukei TaxID=431273 RepID=UPI00157A4BFA|nr:Y-family DNA polymerase [Levilactobacillus senmaizukei]